MRTFIAIDIPEKIKKEILKIQEQLPEFFGKKTEKENLHLTLKFLGEISEEKINEIRKILRKIKFNSFETEIDSIGFFDNRKSYRKQLIIWLHMTHCEDLQKEVDNQLSGLFEKERRFMAHLTIARIKGIKNDKKFFNKLSKIKISPLKFVIKNFILKESIPIQRRRIYKDIEIFKLEI